MKTPVRRILTESDLEKWKVSDTYSDVLNFIQMLATSVEGKELGVEMEISQSVQKLVDLLDKVQDIVKHHPVVQDKDTSRFGKVEFRDFYDEVAQRAEELVGLHNIELNVYLTESWGDRSRIDYGSGHELNFICFLLCLAKLGEVDVEKDAEALVLVVFKKYLDTMRLLQTQYWLEPAGSHGVWGLDDYHFLPFLFGAAQLAPNSRMRPSSIHIPDYVEEFRNKNFYFGCIDFINKTKTGAQSLRWHSPMLDDISGVKKWSKVAEGMVKMYKAEVLGKLPIIQHFLFGDILQAPEGVSSGTEQQPVHQHTFGDCCGIKVPSAVAASAMEHRPIPFD